MAESAFGIDHGDDIEFTKFAGSGVLKPVGNAAKGFKTGFKAKGNDFTPMKPLGQSKGFVGGARAGDFTQRNKKAIGAAAGTGAAGVGAGSMHNRNRQQV
jgi:hypothetical protein